MEKLFCPECNRAFGSEVSLCPHDGADLVASTMDIKPGETYINQYRIIDQISKNALISSFRAENTDNGTTVVVKILSGKTGHNQQSLEHLEERATLFSKLSHENIVPSIDFGKDSNERYYQVTQYVDGEPIESLIKKNGAFSTKEFHSLANQIIDGLIYAEKKGITLQNLDCGNILVSEKANEPLVKIVAFEFSGNEKVEESRTNAIYSLGAIFYRMLARDVPFVSQDMWRLLYQENKTTPESLRKIDSNVPEKIDLLVMSCLENDPKKRISSFQNIKNVLSEAKQVIVNNEEETSDISPSEIMAGLLPAKNGNANEGFGGFSAMAIMAVVVISSGLFYYFHGGAKAPQYAVGTAAEEAIGSLGDEDEVAPVKAIEESTYKDESTYIEDSQPEDTVEAPHSKNELIDTGAVEKKETIAKLLESAKSDLDLFNLTTPPGANALDKYREVLKIDPANESAKAGIDNIVNIYMTMAKNAVQEKRWNRAVIYLDRVDDLSPGNESSKSVRAEVTRLEKESGQ